MELNDIKQLLIGLHPNEFFLLKDANISRSDLKLLQSAMNARHAICELAEAAEIAEENNGEICNNELALEVLAMFDIPRTEALEDARSCSMAIMECLCKRIANKRKQPSSVDMTPWFPHVANGCYYRFDGDLLLHAPMFPNGEMATFISSVEVAAFDKQELKLFLPMVSKLIGRKITVDNLD